MTPYTGPVYLLTIYQCSYSVGVLYFAEDQGLSPVFFSVLALICYAQYNGRCKRRGWPIMRSWACEDNLVPFPYSEEWSASHLLCTTTSFHIFTSYIYHTDPAANRKTINTGPTVGVPGSHCGVNHWLVSCDRVFVLVSKWFSRG